MNLGSDDVEAVARRVVELIEDDVRTPRRSARGLVDAATAARLLGVSRATVYAKADDLGAIRVGRGRRARLRFDPERLSRGTDSRGRSDGPLASKRRPRRKSPQTGSDQLLPIRGGRNGASRDLRS